MRSIVDDVLGYEGRRVLVTGAASGIGTFSVNGAAQPVEAPFGGFKGSGIGREYGPEGLDAFCEKKSIATRPL